MPHFRATSLKHLWIGLFIVIGQLGGPSLRVMWVASGAGMPRGHAPLATLPIPKLRGSTLPHAREPIVRSAAACEGPGKRRHWTGRGSSNSRFGRRGPADRLQVRGNLLAAVGSPTDHPLRF